MPADATVIGALLLEQARGLWPFFLGGILVAALIKTYRWDRRIRASLVRYEKASVLVAVAAGLVSPLCSCGILPVVVSLSAAGVPFPPVLALLITSPLMSPDALVITAGQLGWTYAAWKLAAAAVTGLSAGFLARALAARGIIPGTGFKAEDVYAEGGTVRPGFQEIAAAGCFAHAAAPAGGGSVDGRAPLAPADPGAERSLSVGADPPSAPAALRGAGRWYPTACSSTQGGGRPIPGVGASGARPMDSETPGSGRETGRLLSLREMLRRAGDAARALRSGPVVERQSRLLFFLERFRDMAWLVGRFVAVALLVQAALTYYVPSNAIEPLLGRRSVLSVLIAALIAVPLPLHQVAAPSVIKGFLAAGMSPGAAMAMLIGGPVTSLPALSALLGVYDRRAFLLYLGVGLAAAVGFGYLFQLVSG